MKRIGMTAVLMMLLAGVAGAWDTSKNPDVSPSIGWALHAGRLPGFASDYSRYTEFGADVRLPVTNYLSVKLDYTNVNLGNVQLGVPTSANRIGGEVRVYLRDL